jgi:lysophospholipase L1-like esterase
LEFVATSYAALLAKSMISALLTVEMVSGHKIHPDNPALQYRGCAQVNATAERARFDRLVDATGGFRHDTPGGRILFRTDATSVVAHFRCNQLHTRRDAVNGVGVFFVNGTLCKSYSLAGTRADSVGVLVLQATNPEPRDIEIWLPYAESVDFEGLVVNADARFLPKPARAFPLYVAYGDSITHGFQASNPTLTYPALLAATKGWELINFGFGSRTATADDGKAIGVVPADVITILIGFNDHYGSKPLEQYQADVTGLLRNIRAAQPATPIWLITPLWSTEPWPTKLGLHLEDYRKVLRKIAAAAADPRLQLIEGADLIPAEPNCFTDGVHPNDGGFRVMADRLAAKISLKSS